MATLTRAQLARIAELLNDSRAGCRQLQEMTLMPEGAVGGYRMAVYAIAEALEEVEGMTMPRRAFIEACGYLPDEVI